MDKEAISRIQQICIRKNLPFVSFRMPREEEITTYIQTSTFGTEVTSVHDLVSKEGFLMAPFDVRNGKKYKLLKPDIIFKDEEHIKGFEKVSEMASNPLSSWDGEELVITDKEDYLEQVEAIRNQISTGYFQKAVLSRIKSVEGDYLPYISKMFLDACDANPSAFVYVFKSDGHFWMGASPEPLTRLIDGKVRTISLAGTKAYSPENMELACWSMKEVLEQEYVTRYIHDVLREFKVRDYRVTSPYVKKAGQLAHLRTDFNFDFDQISVRLWDFVQELHPTPAVAGQPKEEAIRFIKQIEPHNREYYTGFVGPISSQSRVDLFVNLRCMKICPDYLALYVGGGITLESCAEDEWDETELKAKGWESIIEKYAKE